MASQRTWQVKEVARIAGVTVRALHHYDEIGLLVPSARSAAGYRLYTRDDLLRLQQIVIGRELGLALEEIRRSLDDPGFDRRRALLAQRRELERRAARTAEMLRAVDHALAMIERPPGLHPEADDPMEMNEEREMDMKELFDGFDPARYEAEAEARWGEGDAYRISKERTRRYTEADWRALRDEQAAILGDAARVQQAGRPPDGDEAMAIAERHRLSIDRWFYPCSPAQHAALADLYEADPRFAANIDKHGPGLTTFLAAAIRANARR